MFNAVYFPCQDSNTGRQTEPSSPVHIPDQRRQTNPRHSILQQQVTVRDKGSIHSQMCSYQWQVTHYFLKKGKNPRPCFLGEQGGHDKALDTFKAVSVKSF